MMNSTDMESNIVTNSSTEKMLSSKLTTYSMLQTTPETPVHVDMGRTNLSFPELLDYDVLLKQENDILAKELVPITIYLVILMIIGVIGNSIVVYIYKFRFKRSTSRIFILSLASFDLVTCILGMPYHIIDMVYPYMFVWNGLCKVLSFALSFTILASIFILNLIAIDRHRKICMPFKKQISGKASMILSWTMVFFGIVCACPNLLIYGSADVPIGGNVTGRECYIDDDYIDSDIPLIYSVFTMLLFFTTVVVLVVLYSRVGYTVWKRRKFSDWSRTNDSKRSTNSTPSTSVLQLNAITDETKIGSATLALFKKDDEDGVVHVFESHSNNCTPGSDTPSNSPSPYRPTTTSVKQKIDKKKLNKKLFRLMSEVSSSGEYESTASERGSTRSHAVGQKHSTLKKQKRTLRITVMLFIITLIFIISFLPYLTIQILNEVNETFWVDLTMGETVFVQFLMRTYFINSMVNPIVYWCLDHKFKEEVSRLFHGIKNCKSPSQRIGRSYHS